MSSLDPLRGGGFDTVRVHKEMQALMSDGLACAKWVRMFDQDYCQLGQSCTPNFYDIENPSREPVE